MNLGIKTERDDKTTCLSSRAITASLPDDTSMLMQPPWLGWLALLPWRNWILRNSLPHLIHTVITHTHVVPWRGIDVNEVVSILVHLLSLYGLFPNSVRYNERIRENAGREKKKNGYSNNVVCSSCCLADWFFQPAPQPAVCRLGYSEVQTLLTLLNKILNLLRCGLWAYNALQQCTIRMLELLMSNDDIL